jgi:tRNA-2-methylthio-N6-dimethylallyladenosine synthase
MEDQIPKETVQERYERLIDLQESISTARNAAAVGQTLEVLVEPPGRKGGLQGRTRTNKIAHFPGDESGSPEPEPVQGTFVDVRITAAHSHYLEAELVRAPIAVS